MTSPSAVLLAHIDIPPQLLGSLIVLGICLVAWFFKAVLFSGPEAGLAQKREGAPSCPTCGKQASWLTPQNYWNCDRCNKPVPMPVAGQPPASFQQPPIIHANPPPPQAYQAQPPQQFCGTCGSPGRWIPESNAWGCDRCRQLIQPR